MYTVRLTRIPENGVHKESGLNLDLDALGLQAPFEPGTLRLSWELSRRMGQIYGTVQAEASMKLTCARCLEDFRGPARADWKVLFEERPKPKPGRGPEAKAKADDGKDDDWDDDPGPTMTYFDGEEVPLGEEARQELELAVPFNPLCAPDCRGLCPRCGRNLNQGPCDCPQGQS